MFVFGCVLLSLNVSTCSAPYYLIVYLIIDHQCRICRFNAPGFILNLIFPVNWGKEKYPSRKLSVFFLIILALSGLLYVFCYGLEIKCFKRDIQIIDKNSTIVLCAMLPFSLFLRSPDCIINIWLFSKDSVVTYVKIHSFPLALIFIIQTIMIGTKIINIQELEKTNMPIMWLVLLLSLISTNEQTTFTIKNHIKYRGEKWDYYKPSILSLYSTLTLIISICIIVWIDLEGFDYVFSNEMEKNANITMFKKYLEAYIQVPFLIISFALHSLGLLISQYYVDKKYNEVYQRTKLRICKQLLPT